jgi:hypothetical protein
VHERTAQQELIAEAQTTGLETWGRREEAQSGSERINEGQGGQKETSQNLECEQPRPGASWRLHPGPL